MIFLHSFCVLRNKIIIFQGFKGLLGVSITGTLQIVRLNMYLRWYDSSQWHLLKAGRWREETQELCSAILKTCVQLQKQALFNNGRAGSWKVIVTDSYLPSVVWRFVSILSSEAPYAHVLSAQLWLWLVLHLTSWWQGVPTKQKKVVALKAEFFLTCSTSLWALKFMDQSMSFDL